MFDCLEEYAPGVRKLVRGDDILTPPDLERVFGLTGGVSCRDVPPPPLPGAHSDTAVSCLTAEHLPRRDAAGPALPVTTSCLQSWLPYTSKGTLPLW